MSFEQAQSELLNHAGVEVSTMMGAPCLRYKGAFLAMMFDKSGDDVR